MGNDSVVAMEKKRSEYGLFEVSLTLGSRPIFSCLRVKSNTDSLASEENCSLDIFFIRIYKISKCEDNLTIFTGDQSSSP